LKNHKWDILRFFSTLALSQIEAKLLLAGI